MSDARKLHPKPGQHLGKRIRNPKKTPKGSNSSTNPYSEPLAEWERELLFGPRTRRSAPRVGRPVRGGRR